MQRLLFKQAVDKGEKFVSTGDLASVSDHGLDITLPLRGGRGLVYAFRSERDGFVLRALLREAYLLLRLGRLAFCESTVNRPLR